MLHSIEQPYARLPIFLKNNYTRKNICHYTSIYFKAKAIKNLTKIDDKFELNLNHQ